MELFLDEIKKQTKKTKPKKQTKKILLFMFIHLTVYNLSDKQIV